MIESCKKKLAFGFVTGGLVVALAGTAFACTIFQGNFTVNGTTATGNGVGMNWCSPPPSASVTRGTAFDASVSPSTGLCAATLTTDDYLFHMIDGTYDPLSDDCMYESTGATRIGTMNVLTGVGSGSYTIPTSAVAGAGMTCVVSNPTAQWGMGIPTDMA